MVKAAGALLAPLRAAGAADEKWEVAGLGGVEGPLLLPHVPMGVVLLTALVRATSGCGS